MGDWWWKNPGIVVPAIVVFLAMLSVVTDKQIEETRDALKKEWSGKD